MKVIIGINKSRGWFTITVSVISFIMTIGCLFCWASFHGNYPNSWLKKNGIEVYANVYDTSWRRIGGNHVGDFSEVEYYCLYKYIAEDGTIYKGNHYSFKTQEDADSHVGEKLLITIGPNGLHRVSRKENITVNFKSSLICAIIITPITLLVIYILIFYGIYRDKLNKKLKSHGQVTTGEISKSVGFILHDVKVKYTDLDSKEQQKWAGYLFRARDVKLLKNKKNIRILVYKNKFGIDEGFNAQK